MRWSHSLKKYTVSRSRLVEHGLSSGKQEPFANDVNMCLCKGRSDEGFSVHLVLLLVPFLSV